MNTHCWFLLPLGAVLLLGPAISSSPAQPAAQPAPASAQPDAAPATPPALHLGTAWYPEQWPESRWAADLSLMEAAHIRFVRIGEFAWSKLEPSEGHYDLDWLARSVRANADHRQFITTNMMGFFDGYDHYTVSQDLDLASWDDYVGTGQLNPIYNGAAHDLTRGFLRKNFWVMETQPGFVNWQVNNNSLDKGAVRAMAWHDVGHGADAVSYWQWRSALNGQEEYHGTLLGADGTPVPLYSEVAQLGADFAKAGPALAGTTIHSDVAILHSYDAFWAINWQRHNHAFDPLAAMIGYYGAIRALTHSVDIVNPSVDLSQYKLVIAPALNVLTDQQAKNLIDYVHNGGHLVLTQRSAMKTIDNALQPQRQPGPLVPLLGGRVEQFYALDTTIPISGAWGSGPTNTWAELLSTSSPDTKVLMRYGKTPLGWLDDQPAAITRKVGDGSITYIGADLQGDTLANAAKWMVADANLHPEFGTLPPGVDLYIRSDDHHEVWILINFGDTPQTITLPSAFEDVLANASKNTTHSVTLNRFDVVVLQRPAH